MCESVCVKETPFAVPQPQNDYLFYRKLNFIHLRSFARSLGVLTYDAHRAEWFDAVEYVQRVRCMGANTNFIRSQSQKGPAKWLFIRGNASEHWHFINSIAKVQTVCTRLFGFYLHCLELHVKIFPLHELISSDAWPITSLRESVLQSAQHEIENSIFVVILSIRWARVWSLFVVTGVRIEHTLRTICNFRIKMNELIRLWHSRLELTIQLGSMFEHVPYRCSIAPATSTLHNIENLIFFFCIRRYKQRACRGSLTTKSSAKTRSQDYVFRSSTRRACTRFFVPFISIFFG